MFKIIIFAIFSFTSISFLYSQHQPYEDISGKWGYIYKDAIKNEVHITVLPKYDAAYPFINPVSGSPREFAMVKLNDKYGFIDRKGKEVVPLKYDEVNFFSEGLAAVKLNGKWGFVDKTGKEVIPLKYDDGGNFINGKASVVLNGDYITIDKTGKIIKK